MAILKIAKMGNPVLGEVADAVEDPTSDDVASLVEDMRETLDDIGANGLAAPQVHVSRRVIVYRITAHQIPPNAKLNPVDWQALINPVLTPLSQDQKPIWERCLSIPGLHGEVPRYTRVQLDAIGLDGKGISIKASGFHAMLLQHECDHLNGILYPERMIDLSKLAFNSELGDTGFFIPRDPAEFSE